MKQFRKFDKELDRIILDDNYFFAFTESDGFTERLLGATLTIDVNYNDEFELRAFDHKKKTKNNSNSIIEKGEIPDQILAYLEELLESDYMSLKNVYDHKNLYMSGRGMQQYLINFEKATINIHIVNGLSEYYFNSEAEKILFKFNEFLKEYVENKYQNWLK